MASKLIQIIYDEKQREKCYPFAEIYFNEGLTIFFENTVIADLVSASKADKIAICSWKLKEKMKWYIGKPREITQELLESDYEVLSFTKNSQYHRMLEAANKWHQGFRQILSKILIELGISMPMEVKNPIYQNHFSAKREIYQDYVSNYLLPTMQVMKNDPEINKLVMQDSKYSELDRSTKNQLDIIESKLGVRYYPLAPFVLERLFSIYCHNNKINVSWL